MSTSQEEVSEDLMDVIDHAIETGDVGSPTPPEHSDESAEGDEDSLDGVSDGEADDSGDPDGAGDGDADGEEEGEGEGEGRQRGPDGKFVKPGEKPGEKKPEEKPEGAKKPDPLNDPIPKELARETQDRIRTLIKSTREATETAERAQGNFDEIIRGIQATGTTPDQYREVLSFMALFNSGDTAQQEKALELIEGVADRLATLLGKERTVSDVLAKHEDLRAAVAAGKIAPEYAKEIARTRNAQGFRSELDTQATESQRAQQAAEKEKADARVALNNLEAQLKRTDRDYERKKAQLVPILQTIFPTVPPREWANRFHQAYQQIKLAPRGAIPRQPMRAGGGVGNGKGRAAGNSGGMGQEPGSMLDAVSDALANMPRS